jgi:hypothetical protein
VAGNELNINQGDNPLQLACGVLDENGEVMGALPGQIVIGPPVDLDGDGQADNAAGAPAPTDHTVRELEELANGGVQEVRDPEAQPVDMAVVEEGPPTPAELDELNRILAAQIPGIEPLQGPFQLCIREFKVRRIWGIDRRVVYDTWFHHWTWRLSHHFSIQRRAYRVWLTKASIAQFASMHHHYVAGQPPVWRTYKQTHIRFFRVCYRIFMPRPNVLRAKIDEVHVVLPENPDDPNSPLMLVTTLADENELLRRLPPAVLAGQEPDPLPVDEKGVFVEELPEGATADFLPGGTGVLTSDALELPAVQNPAGLGMMEFMNNLLLHGNRDRPEELNNTQLKLFCWLLDSDGNIRTETLGGPAGGSGGSGPGGVTLSTGPTEAIPVFEDPVTGETTENPTKFMMEVMAEEDVMRISRQNGRSLQVDWTGFGALLASPTVDGEYAPVAEASNPFILSPDGPQEYFQVRREVLFP